MTMVKPRPTIPWDCAFCSMRQTRREFLAKLGAAGAVSALPAAALGQAGAGASEPFRIDVHHHYASPGFVAELIRRDMGNPRYREWTPQVSLDEMEASSVASVILSSTRPGVWFGDAALAGELSRELNEYGARLVNDYPGRFGLFATLPLPDVEGTLREIEYAFDVLDADGVTVMSNYDDIYLGDPRLEPVMAELDRRRAVVYEHPIREDRENPFNGIELLMETTRTIASLIGNGTVVRYPNIRFIFAHGGGTVGASVGRMNGLARDLPHGLMYELQKFYYDTGQAYIRSLLASYKALVPISQILFGTDFPFRTAAVTAEGLRENGNFSAAELRAIERENALRLFPRLDG